METLYLLKLYRHSLYLPPYKGKVRTLSPASNAEELPEWWKHASKELRTNVLKKREKDEDISAVVKVVKKLPDVTIFTHEYNPKWGKYTNPQVISNKDIKSVTVLKTSMGKVKSTDMVYAEWIDASHNATPATIKDVEKDYGVMDIVQLGFLMHKNKTRVFIGGRYNATYGKYRYLGAIPTVNVKKIQKLVEAS